ncbi:MAG: molecular chaperone DnaJ [Candidatus Kerfeldbacteria bacterium]|nr:molecular chaperone DnaJ [Candidatus Kerfeldbacteria bacterium]
MAKDYYQVLGVSKDATTEDIKRAFRRLAHQYHPDKSGGDAARFKEINEAYQTLSDPKKREQYDRFGTTASQTGGMNWQDFQRAGGFDFRTGSDGFGDFGDIFGEVFGFGGRRRTSRPTGSDVEVELSIDFRESLFGTDKVLELSGLHVCSTCHGRGAAPGSAMVKCGTCDGSGVVEQVQQTFFIGLRSQATCPTCNGSGEVPKQKCKRCHGTGSVRGQRQLKITIPAGIDDGQSIRLKSQGQPGPRGTAPGDLYVRIRVRPDPMFRREGDELHTRRTISFTQAALGAKVPIDTVDGPVQLDIPAGTQSGKLFRLRAKGVPRLDGNGRGDQIVEMVVKIPDRLSREQRHLLEKFSQTE